MSQPTSLEDLHLQLLANDPSAPAEIVARLFVPICEALRRKYPARQFEELANQAAGDALVSYLKRPEQYDSAKGELSAYLRMSAMGDFKNALRSERNRQEKIQPGVELSQIAGKEEPEADSFLSAIHADELREEIRKLFREERDWELAALIIDQERRTEAFAEILGITHLPMEEQRSEVKRHKDRIKQKLRRFGENFRDSTESE